MQFRRRNFQSEADATEIPLSETKTSMSVLSNRNNNNNNNNNSPLSPRSIARSRNAGAKIWFLIVFLFSVVAFYAGLIAGWSNAEKAEEIATLEKKIRDLEAQLERKTKAAGKNNDANSSSNNNNNIFDQDHTGSFASGIEFVDRDEFAAAFDTGVPLDQSTKGNDRVAILYSDAGAFPKISSRENGKVLSVEEATSNCHNLHLVLTHTAGRKNQCIAIMGQYESFHIHKFMRVDGEKGKVDEKLPLEYTSRGH